MGFFCFNFMRSGFNYYTRQNENTRDGFFFLIVKAQFSFLSFTQLQYALEINFGEINFKV